METISYTAFRNHLASSMDQVRDNHEPLLVTRQNGSPAVVMSLEDFKSYEETAYLMANPKNAERLTRAIDQLESGNGTTRDLLES
ncbi:MAG: type II toxin-antitoxin system prevent-host-death family antitoxin [Mariprofundaceae bacterium]|nr:type II toxin-antitoxin system prevent-host-death family antitoxin [Mariprofundaceae bacterium]